MEKVALWWDMDSCPLPSHIHPYLIRWMANSVLENFNIRGSGVGQQFSAYKYPSAEEADIELGQIMFNSGVSLELIQPALAGNSNEIEKKIMADMLLWAMDVPPPGDIIFIGGNVDFSYVLRKLREKSYNVFLVCASVAQMPYGMLSSANEWMEWLSFLRLLEQNEETLQFSSNGQAWGSENYEAFSNFYPRSPSTVSSKEWEEHQNRSTFCYIPENSSAGQPTFNNGCDWDSSQSSIPPLNDAFAATMHHSQGPVCQGHCSKFTEKSTDTAGKKHRNRKPSTTAASKKKLSSMYEFRAWLRRVVNSEENQNGYNVSPVRMDFEKATGKKLDFMALGFPKMINLLEQCQDIAELKEVKKGCHMAFPVKNIKPNPVKNNKPNLVKTNQPNPNSKPMKEKPENSQSGVIPNPNPQPYLKPPQEAEEQSMLKASAEDFHNFLLDMVSTGEFSQGFLMSQLPQKFKSVSGKCLDIQHLGFQKLVNLVEVYTGVVSVVKTGPGPMRLYPAVFVGETVPNCNFNRTSDAEVEKKSMPKASLGDFHVFLIDMLSMGEFSQGLLMSELRKKFECVCGKSLDIQHLGFQKLTNLVEVYGNLVSLDKTGPGPPRVYPADFVRKTVPTSNLSRKSEEISINMANYIAKQDANIEVDRPSTDGSDRKPEYRTRKGNISDEDLAYQNSESAITESEWPFMSLNSFPSMSFTATISKGTGFQEYINKSDSCSTPQGSQVSEWEGQFSNTVSELSSCADAHQLEGSEYVKQFLSNLQREGNNPIGNSTNAEASQNMIENKDVCLQNTIENRSVCKEAITVSETATHQNSSGISFGRELPDVASSQLDPPFIKSKVSCNIPISLQQSMPQDTAVCPSSHHTYVPGKEIEEIAVDSSLECKQSQQNAKSSVNGERNVHGILSPAESIMQVAERGLKTIREFSMWKKSQ